MIRVVKPTPGPEILVDRGTTRRATDEAAFEAGARQFEFDRRIYSDDTVRTTLSLAQHGKCCFCEAKIHHISDGDVEHFRPKAGYRQARNLPLQRPGYYWLAYAWSNLYLACQMCNQRNKQSLFPLEDPATRVRSHEHADALARERPMFIDPGVDEPESLLGYRSGEPFAIDGNARATTTIRELELGRVHLMERRWEQVKMIELLLGVVQHSFAGAPIDAALIEGAAEWLAMHTRDEAEFASLTRGLLRDRLNADLHMPVTAKQLLAHVNGEGGLPVE